MSDLISRWILSALASWVIVRVSVSLMTPIRLFGGAAIVPALTLALAINAVQENTLGSQLSDEKSVVMSHSKFIVAESADPKDSERSWIGSNDRVTRDDIRLKRWVGRTLSVVLLFALCLLLSAFISVIAELNEEASHSDIWEESGGVLTRLAIFLAAAFWFEHDGHLLWWEALSNILDLDDRLLEHSPDYLSPTLASSSPQLILGMHCLPFEARLAGFVVLVFGAKAAIESVVQLGSVARRYGRFESEMRALRIGMTGCLLVMIWDRTPWGVVERLQLSLSSVVRGGCE